MFSRKCPRAVALIAFAVFISTGFVFAQSDPNPNSPSPVLLEGETNRALAAPADKSMKAAASKANRGGSDVFSPDQEILLYVAETPLSVDEDANAFRVYARDANNRIYRFPILGIDKLSQDEQVYVLRIKLHDEIGFWPQPQPTGDLLIQVSWRGMASNQLLLGFGKTGGLKFDPPKKAADEKNLGDSDDYVGYRWSGDRKRFLEQATFGPTKDLDQRVRRIGLRVWLAEQFNAPYPSAANPYPDYVLKPAQQDVGCPFQRGTPEYIECVRTYYTQYPVMNWFFKEAFYGDAQLRHRVAWALSQLWVTSGQTIQQSSHMIAYHKVLSAHAFGNYRDLMKDMTLNPAMGDYLDMARSTKNTPNENYAREILQLFTVGLFMLNQDGTLQTGNGGAPIPTYSQDTVNNFTKVFTGFRFCNVGCPNSTDGAVNFKDPLVLQQNLHDVTAKTLLDYPNAVNKNIAANLNGNTELDLALDNIFNHPNLGPFVGRFLIQHLVTSDPSPAYVSRVAAAFNNNGAGIRGDMKAVVKAILLDPEARGDVKTDPFYGKLREPVQLTTNIYRQFDVLSADRTQPSDGVVFWLPQLMGQFPFYANTVFNYYTPNYIVPGTSLLAPEFGIMNTGTAIQRTNMTTIMSFVNIDPDPGATWPTPVGSSIDVNDLIQLSSEDPTGNSVVDELDRRLMHSTMSPEMRQSILTAMAPIAQFDHNFKVRTALFLIASSSQYQIQR
ncbi:MAG: DUF1800 domain-containing protein [Pyrinomonadaceae bacterium]